MEGGLIPFGLITFLIELGVFTFFRNHAMCIFGAPLLRPKNFKIFLAPVFEKNRSEVQI